MIAAATNWIIPIISLAALILSLAGIIFTAMIFRQKANADFTHSLESRLESIDVRLLACEEAREKLGDENLRLLRELFREQRP